MNKKFLISFFVILAIIAFLVIVGFQKTQQVSTNTCYGGLVILPNHLTQEQRDQQLTDFYGQWKEYYLLSVEGSDPVQKYVYYNREHIAEPEEAISCSEGQGYGMLISVMMAEFDPEAKSDFDAQYRYYKAHTSPVTPQFMAWQQVMDDNVIKEAPDGGEYSATDGDMDIAYALLAADQVWGSDENINYREEALAVIGALMDTIVHSDDFILKLGNWVDETDPVYGSSTRLSDFMLEHIMVFQKYDKENAEKWSEVYEAMTSVINEQCHRNNSKDTGLMPDFMIKDPQGEYVPAGPDFLEGEHDGDYHYNACRIPWRFSMDFIINGSSEVKAQLNTLNRWIMETAKGNPENIKSGYRVNSGIAGESYEDYGDLCFAAPFMVSAMIDPSNQEWLNSLWDYVVDYSIDDAAYYDNTLKLLAMIVAGGHWISPDEPE